ncbi:MAG: hypothetical protein ABL949_07615 [Fimbriimonadaceae bacterium]
MSFSVRLDTEQVSVDPGESAILSVHVTNAGPEVDQFELEVSGLDSDWVALPVPSFSLPPGQNGTLQVVFKPPRTADNLAAAYPFTLRVRSLESGDSQMITSQLLLNAFHHVSMDLLPKRGAYGPMVRDNIFEVSIVNLGNCEHELQFFGSDPEDELGYDFEAETLTVGAGQQRDIEVITTPIKSRPIAGSKLYGFSINARSINYPTVSCGTQGQLEHKPVVSPGTFAVLIAFVLLVFGWLNFAPKPPTMEVLQLDQTEVKVGEIVKLTWQSANAKSVRIRFNNRDVVTAGPPSGSQEFPARESGQFEAIAIVDSKQSAPMAVSLTVSEPVKIEKPVIESFSTTKRRVEPGGQFDVRYHVTGTNVTTTVIVYRDKDIFKSLIVDSSKRSETVQAPVEPGTYRVKLEAKNDGSEGTQRVESRWLSLEVEDLQKVEIQSFEVTPNPVDPVIAKVTVKWRVKGANRIDLRVGSNVTTLQSDSGQIEQDIFKTETFELIVEDANGKTTRKSIRVEVKVLEPPADDSKVADPPPKTDTGSTGGG